MTVNVYKVGGSLFNLPDLGLRLHTLLAQRCQCAPLLIPGGGPTVDLVRNWDRQFGLDDETAHWLAIAGMSFNARLLASLLQRAEVVTDRQQAAECWKRQGIAVLSTEEFLRAEEATVAAHERLPCSWDVTADSISAWIAQRWPAEELVLVKSCDAPTSDSSAAIDKPFTKLAKNCRSIGWVNLRADEPVIEPWSPPTT